MALCMFGVRVGGVWDVMCRAVFSAFDGNRLLLLRFDGADTRLPNCKVALLVPQTYSLLVHTKGRSIG
jgi:hypothetical protein